MQVRPITNVLGAVVDGVDLKSMSDETLDAVEGALARHLVLYLPDQDLDRFQMRAMARRFGPTFPHPIETTRFDDCPEVLDVRRGPGLTRVFGGGGWHADATWKATPPRVSFLHGRTVPPVGGDTCFVSTVAAFASLSPTLKAMLRGLRAIHLYHGYDGGQDVRYTAIHPVVRQNARTGAEGLYINSMFVTHFDGMTPAESRPLLEFLYRRLEEYRFSCRVRWRPRGLLMWDNRFTLHLPINDTPEAVRRMLWTSCEERPATSEQTVKAPTA